MKIHSVKYNAIYNIIYTLSNIVFPLITFPYVSRILMATGNGKVNFFSSIATYGTTVASLGISTYGIRAVAKVRDDKNKLSKLTSELLIINSIGTFLVIGTLIASFAFVNKFQNELGLFVVTCLTILMSTIGMNWLYSGLEQYDYITRRSILFKFISLVLVFIFVRTKKDYLNYSIIMAFSTVGSYVLNFIYARKFINYKFNIFNMNLKKHMQPTLLLFSSILAVSIYTNLDTVMLGFYSGDRAVGLYTVAVKVKWLLLMLINALSAVLLPRLSKHVEENNLDTFRDIIKQSSDIIFFVSIPLTIFFMVTALDTIKLIGGSDYVSAAVCMQILMPILVISGFSNITGNQILIPFGKDKAFLYAVSTGALLNVIINIIILPKYGANGAAVATLIAEVSQMLIQSYFCRDVIKSAISLRSFMHYLSASVVAGFFILIMNMFYNSNPILNLLVYSIIFGCIYVTYLCLIRDRFVMSSLKKLNIRVK